MTFVDNVTEKEININNKTHLVSSLNQFQQIFEIYKNAEFIVCSLNESGGKSIMY